MLCDTARAAVAAGHNVVVLTPEAWNGTGDQRNGELAEQERHFDRSEPYLIQRSSVWARLFHLGGHRIGLISRLARVAIIFYLFWRVLWISQIDLLVVGHVLPLGSVAAALRRLKGIPFLVVTYGEDVSVYARRPRMRAMLVTAFREAAAVLCLTRDSAEEIASVAPQMVGPVEVLSPQAVLPPPSGNPPDLSKVLQPFPARRFLLTVSRLVPRKGIDTALRAFAQLAAELPDVGYIIVGEGPDKVRLQKLAGELGIADRVGFVPGADSVADFYYACEAFVMPNRTMPDGEREGYGIVFLEAALAGKPSIAGRSGGAPDAVEDGVTGLVVDPDNPAATAEAMRRLLNDPGLARRMGEAGQQRALAIASPAAFREKLERVLERAIGQERGASPPTSGLS